MLLNRIATNKIALPLTVSFLLCTRLSLAQAETRPMAISERAESELRAIQSAVARHATEDELGKLWGQLASDYLNELEMPQAEQAYDHALNLLSKSVAARHDYALALDGLGTLYGQIGRMAESENCHRKALAIFDAEGDLTYSLALHANLAVLMQNEGRSKDAEKEASIAIEGMLGQARSDASDLTSAFIARGYARCRQRRCKEGLSDADQAVDIVRAYLPPNSLLAASSWSALGYMQWKTGDRAGAEEKMRRALQILSDKSDLPYPVLVAARIRTLGQYQQFLNETRRKQEAQQIGDERARLKREQAPVCKNCTVNVKGLSK